MFSVASGFVYSTGFTDVCIHLAWRDGFNHRSEYHIQSIPQHFTFIRTLLAGGLKQLAVMGSMHEVGYHEGMISEQTPCNPSSYYGIGKNTLRQVCLLLGKNSARSSSGCVRIISMG
jgi:dTDP-6-deoxy-L-talose 4-dehydrogenase (NAD+)